MSEISQRYTRWAEIFGAKVAAVPEEAWSRPSPNPGWTARDVVGHVVDSTQHFLTMVGVEVENRPPVEQDPMGAWVATRDAVIRALEDPIIATTEMESMGAKKPWEQLVDGYVSFDLVVHAWDVARATGVDEHLDPEAVSEVFRRAQDIVDQGRAYGAFGPEVEVAADASEQDRMLGLLGRTP